MSMEPKTFTKEIYDQLIKAVDKLPKEAVESTKKETTRKGYDTTGYQYQFLVNVLNEIVTPAGWGYTYEVANVIQGQYKSGQTFYEITVSTTVQILGAVRTAPGGHISSSYSDALKGAITNALKKTFGMFGIGKKAYEGTLDEDYQPIGEVASRQSGPIYGGVKTKPSVQNAMTAPCDNIKCKGVAKLQYGKLCYTCNQFVKGGGQLLKLRSEGAVEDEEVPPPGDKDVPF